MMMEVVMVKKEGIGAGRKRWRRVERSVGCERERERERDFT